MKGRLRKIERALKQKKGNTFKPVILFYTVKRDKETGEFYYEHEGKKYTEAEWEQFKQELERKNPNIRYIYPIEKVYPTPEYFIENLFIGERSEEEMLEKLKREYEEYWADQYYWHEVLEMFEKIKEKKLNGLE